ncbi:MAG: hypothetical protein JW969_19410 [Spirochaetales bacterium]|nr:hypothetical protein [Spirochaetales bacterium]
MNAIKTLYDSLPETIIIPKEFVNHKAEIIIILEDDENASEEKNIVSYFGCLPDFPERCCPDNYETRESL